MKKARADVAQQQPWGAQPPPGTIPPMQSQTQSPFANPSNTWYSPQHSFQPHMQPRRNDQLDYRYAQQPATQGSAQQQHPTPVQPPMNVSQQQQHAQQHAHQHHQQHSQPHPPPQAAPVVQQPAPAPAPAPARSRKRPASAAQAPAPTPVPQPQVPAQTPVVPPAPAAAQSSAPPAAPSAVPTPVKAPAPDDSAATPTQPPAKKSRTNTPWTPAEELRLKQMRDAGNSWAEIAKTFPTRTEGSVKKHWYKDMHYAEFAEDESQALLLAIKEYENNKWKVIGQKVGKPAKACEQYAKENFADQFPTGGGKR